MIAKIYTNLTVIHAQKSFVSFSAICRSYLERNTSGSPKSQETAPKVVLTALAEACPRRNKPEVIPTRAKVAFVVKCFRMVDGTKLWRVRTIVPRHVPNILCHRAVWSCTLSVELRTQGEGGSV